MNADENDWTHLLCDLGLRVCLAFILVLGHLLWHCPANGFLKLLERLLQTPPLQRAEHIISLFYASLLILRTHYRNNHRDSAVADVASVDSVTPQLGPEAKRLLCRVTHLFIEVKFSSTFDQGILAAGQE